MSIIKMTDLDLNNKRVLIRADLNVPIEAGKVTSTKRVAATIPTIQLALKQNARVIVMSHLGRPKENEYNAKYSLAPVAKSLSKLLGQQVHFINDWNQNLTIQPGEVALLQNVRFLTGEKTNDTELAKKMAAMCDIFVMEAFGTAHRKHASTYGVAEFAPIACAGPLLTAEIATLQAVMKDPKRPLLAIIGGAKVSTKLTVLESLLQKVDQLIVGGGIANTMLAASGFNVGKSLYEPDLVPEAKRLLEFASIKGIRLPLPSDVVVAKHFALDAAPIHKSIMGIEDDEIILDIGTDTQWRFKQFITTAGTILWNGPVGVFEWPQFSKGTQTVVQAIADSAAFSVAGGGETLAAIEKYGVEDKISYISTGGGAFLEFLEGKKLPAIAILEQRAASTHKL
jgi:phosphoglycerate kinase